MLPFKVTLPKLVPLLLYAVAVKVAVPVKAPPNTAVKVIPGLVDDVANVSLNIKATPEADKVNTLASVPFVPFVLNWIHLAVTVYLIADSLYCR